MESTPDLTLLFLGFIRHYRSLNLRFDPRHESRTHWTASEIGWFAALGEQLGYYSVRERDVFGRRRPVDLVWLHPLTHTPILHLERENDTTKIAETIDMKLLPTNAPCATLCIGIFDETTQNEVDLVRALAGRAFEHNPRCHSALFISYSRLPSVKTAARYGTPRFKMRWPVTGLVFSRAATPHDVHAHCTTDENYFYVMHCVSPKLPGPYTWTWAAT